MNDLTILKEYVVPMTIAFCLVIGQLIKYVPAIKNNYIPVIVALFGLVFNIWVNNFSLTPLIVLQGLASGLASTGVFELAKNILKQEEPKILDEK